MDDVKADLFHSLTSKLIYITKKTIPDIEPDVPFFTPRVAKRNVGDWKKLRRFISYLNQTVEDVRIIGGFNLTDLLTWFDASYDVHPNVSSQIGGVMSMGCGMLHCRSSKQNINAKSST